MRNTLIAIAATAALLSAPSFAFAQNNATGGAAAGATAGAVGGAIVGGPVGAAVGAVGGAVVGGATGAATDQNGTTVVVPAEPRSVKRDCVYDRNGNAACTETVR